MTLVWTPNTRAAHADPASPIPIPIDFALVGFSSIRFKGWRIAGRSRSPDAGSHQPHSRVGGPCLISSLINSRSSAALLLLYRRTQPNQRCRRTLTMTMQRTFRPWSMKPLDEEDRNDEEPLGMTLLAIARARACSRGRADREALKLSAVRPNNLERGSATLKRQLFPFSKIIPDEYERLQERRQKETAGSAEIDHPRAPTEASAAAKVKLWAKEREEALKAA